MKRFTVAEMFGYSGLALMIAIWLAFARYVVLGGGFYAQRAGTRRSAIPYDEKFFYVEGPMAIAFAYIFLSLAALGVAMILKRFEAPVWARVCAGALILGWPLAYRWAVA